LSVHTGTAKEVPWIDPAAHYLNVVIFSSPLYVHVFATGHQLFCTGECL